MGKNDRLFDTVLMRPPSDSYPQAVPDGGINLELAKRQHERYREHLRAPGVKVILLLPRDDYPDSVFMQDPAVVGKSVALIGNFSNPSRRGEERAISSFFQNRKHIDFVREPARLEGGDVLITDRKVFIGVSQRTNEAGVVQFSKAFVGIEVEAVPVDAMHLMCFVSYLTGSDLLACPNFVDVSRFGGFNLIQVPESEVPAANALYLGDRHVLMLEGYPATKQSLIDRKYVPIEIDISEYQKAYGSISCLCLPFYTHF